MIIDAVDCSEGGTVNSQQLVYSFRISASVSLALEYVSLQSLYWSSGRNSNYNKIATRAGTAFSRLYTQAYQTG